MVYKKVLNMIQITLYVSLFFGVVYTQDSCWTPNNENGTCISLPQCDPLLKILKKIKGRIVEESSLQYLRASTCGFDGLTPKVCCKSTTEPSVEPDFQDKIHFTSTEPGLFTSDPLDVSTHPNLKFLNHSICGPSTFSKVIGGKKTGILEYTWMALLNYNNNGKKEFRCSGTIISDRYILTAAHCLINLPKPLVLDGVRVGEHDLSTEYDCDRDEEGIEIICSEGYQDFGVESYQAHPDFNSSILKNDIGLIRLNKEIDFSPVNVKPICLPVGTAAKLEPKKLTVLGWGATEDGPRSPYLRKVTLLQVDNEKCAKIYPKRIWYKQICAGGKDGKDSCGGDSGGPLIAPAFYKNDVRFVQYGIVSFGHKRCGTKGIPGVYTRVTHFMDWILNTMKD